jgi:hypothetical protein
MLDDLNEICNQLATAQEDDFQKFFIFVFFIPYPLWQLFPAMGSCGVED